MRFPARLLASALLAAAALTTHAHADTINLSLTGSNGTFTFSLLSTAAPLTSNIYFNEFALTSATYNNRTIADDTVTFYTPADNGGLYLTNASGSAYFSEFGPQIFSGSTASPLFTNGTFILSNGSSLVDGVTRTGGGDTLTVSVIPDSISTVPEPASITLFASGAMGLISFLRRGRRAHQA